MLMVLLIPSPVIQNISDLSPLGRVVPNRRRHHVPERPIMRLDWCRPQWRELLCRIVIVPSSPRVRSIRLCNLHGGWVWNLVGLAWAGTVIWAIPVFVLDRP